MLSFLLSDRMEVDMRGFTVVGDLRFGTPPNKPWPQTFCRWMGAAKVYRGDVHVADLRGRGDPVEITVMTDSGPFRPLLVDNLSDALDFLCGITPVFSRLPSAITVEKVWEERGGDDLWD